MTPTWRVGNKVPINVYDGDRPVCQCHNPRDAEMIVRAVNDLLLLMPVMDAEGLAHLPRGHDDMG